MNMRYVAWSIVIMRIAAVIGFCYLVSIDEPWWGLLMLVVVIGSASFSYKTSGDDVTS